MHKIARCLMLFYGFLRIAISTDDLEGSLPLILFSGPNFSRSTPCVCHKYIHVSFPVKIQSRHFGSLSRPTQRHWYVWWCWVCMFLSGLVAPSLIYSECADPPFIQLARVLQIDSCLTQTLPKPAKCTLF